MLLEIVGLKHTLCRAEDSFRKALAIEKQDGTFVQLAKVFSMQDKYNLAIQTFLDALTYSPENPEIHTQLGLAYLRQGRPHILSAWNKFRDNEGQQSPVEAG